MNNPPDPLGEPAPLAASAVSMIIYTPETIVGDDEIVFDDTAHAASASASAAPPPPSTYTVRFKINRNGQAEDNDGLSPISGSSYPASDSKSPVKGALFQVALFTLQGTKPTPIDPAAYTVTGLNGLQKKRRRATFDLEFTGFTYPPGQDSVSVLLVVSRKNADNTEASTALVIRVHRTGA